MKGLFKIQKEIYFHFITPLHLIEEDLRYEYNHFTIYINKYDFLIELKAPEEVRVVLYLPVSYHTSILDFENLKTLFSFFSLLPSMIKIFRKLYRKSVYEKYNKRGFRSYEAIFPVFMKDLGGGVEEALKEKVFNMKNKEHLHLFKKMLKVVGKAVGVEVKKYPLKPLIGEFTLLEGGYLKKIE